MLALSFWMPWSRQSAHHWAYPLFKQVKLTGHLSTSIFCLWTLTVVIPRPATSAVSVTATIPARVSVSIAGCESPLPAASEGVQSAGYPAHACDFWARNRLIRAQMPTHSSAARTFYCIPVAIRALWPLLFARSAAWQVRFIAGGASLGLKSFATIASSQPPSTSCFLPAQGQPPSLARLPSHCWSLSRALSTFAAVCESEGFNLRY